MRQDYFNHPCEIFDLAFTLCDFPNISGLYQLVPAGTSSEKFFVGLLMEFATLHVATDGNESIVFLDLSFVVHIFIETKTVFV